MIKHMSSNILPSQERWIPGYNTSGCHGRCIILPTVQPSRRSGVVSQMGEIWVFFIFNVADSSDEGGGGGTVSISEEFRLGEDLSGLLIVLGLLSDWIINSKKREQQFFTYFDPLSNS